jgi:hypothetical protein
MLWLHKVGDRELAGMYQKGESARKYLNEITARNGRIQEDINKKELEIEKARQDHHVLFKVAIETIMKKIKDFEAEVESKGFKVVKYGYLESIIDEEQTKI